MLTLLTNAHVYAPENLGLKNLLLSGDRIVYIGDDVPSISGLGVQTVDCGGNYLVPGFIDAHTHITGGGGEAGLKTKVPPVPISQFTSAGVTTVIGLLGADDVTRNISSLIAQVYGLREEGLNAYCYTGGYHLPLATLTGSARSDIVHIECVVGVGELAISDHRSSQPTFNEIIRIASETHMAGLMTGKAGVLHLHLGDGPRGLSLIRQALSETEIPARVFNPTHVNRQKFLFEEACELAKQGCTIDVTAYPPIDGFDDWTASEAIARYISADLPADKITVSSDGGGCLPVFDKQGEVVELDYGRSAILGITLRELVAEGFTLERVLPCFTSNIAQLLRLHDKGRIAEGKSADLVLLNKEYVVEHVMVSGQWHMFEQQQKIVGTFEKNDTE